MKKRNRNILIVVLSIFVLIGGLGIYGLYGIYSTLTGALSREIPPALKETRVFKGAELVTRTTLFELKPDGTFETLRKSYRIEDDTEREKFIRRSSAETIYGFDDIKVIGDEIIAVGRFGGFVFDLNGQHTRQIAFDFATGKDQNSIFNNQPIDAYLENVRIVQLEKDKYGFLTWGEFTGVRVMDQNGRQLWSYGIVDVDTRKRRSDYEKRSMHYILQAAVGDLDNDGLSEYIVSQNKEGIHAFDRSGAEKWFQAADDAASHMEVIDLDNDGKNELVQLGTNVRDGKDGKIIRGDIGGVGRLVLFNQDQKDKGLLACTIFDGRFSCAADRKRVFEGTAPLSEVESRASSTEYPEKTVNISMYPKAVWVALQKDKPKYLAVIAAFIGIPRANLYIYAPDGTLVYHELLPENAETIALLPGENGVEALLVGGKNTIWKYAG